ncbi:MAG: 23S rRNA (guanine(745)-N(1))-methyltransferase [Gammaproteobacteria bacterium]|nr:MAG: 23S rRNA (guanine(745)-N(1))-methyltransferase [Gammaproteobacteria bacterium]
MPSCLPYKCPVCEQPLTLESKTYRCENKHAFDAAKEGYVNLHLVQHKRSKHPGDSAEMIVSRRDFLNQGYYQALSDGIVKCLSALPLGLTQSVLDVGCGEGYYLQQLRGASEGLQLTGIDLSKPAVRLAAKRKLGAQLSVINADALPFFDQCFDSVLSVFAPLNVSEVARVLKKGGHLIMVGPGESHLSEMAAHIYDQVTPHQGNYQILAGVEAFELVEELEVKQEITVAGGDVLNLLTMTPYYWHATEAQKESLSKLERLVTTVHFCLKVYRVI